MQVLEAPLSLSDDHERGGGRLSAQARSWCALALHRIAHGSTTPFLSLLCRSFCHPSYAPFTPDFKDAQCLLNSEVAVLLELRQKTAAGANDHSATPAFQQTLAYVQRFSRFKNKEAFKDIRLCASH